MVEENEQRYFTQKQLAQRWHCTEGSIINYRNKGIIPCFQLPESTKVLYPVEDIIEIEKNNTTRKGGDKPVAEVKRVKPCVSSSTFKEWRM
jgi:hypothetical protein